MTMLTIHHGVLSSSCVVILALPLLIYFKSAVYFQFALQGTVLAHAHTVAKSPGNKPGHLAPPPTSDGQEPRLWIDVEHEGEEEDYKHAIHIEDVKATRLNSTITLRWNYFVRSEEYNRGYAWGQVLHPSPYEDPSGSSYTSSAIALTGNTANTGSFNWTVPCEAVSGQRYRFRLCSGDPPRKSKFACHESKGAIFVLNDTRSTGCPNVAVQQKSGPLAHATSPGGSASRSNTRPATHSNLSKFQSHEQNPAKNLKARPIEVLGPLDVTDRGMKWLPQEVGEGRGIDAGTLAASSNSGSNKTRTRGDETTNNALTHHEGTETNSQECLKNSTNNEQYPKYSHRKEQDLKPGGSCSQPGTVPSTYRRSVPSSRPRNYASDAAADHEDVAAALQWDDHPEIMRVVGDSACQKNDEDCVDVDIGVCEIDETATSTPNLHAEPESEGPSYVTPEPRRPDETAAGKTAQPLRRMAPQDQDRGIKDSKRKPLAIVAYWIGPLPDYVMAFVATARMVKGVDFFVFHSRPVDDDDQAEIFAQIRDAAAPNVFFRHCPQDKSCLAKRLWENVPGVAGGGGRRGEVKSLEAFSVDVVEESFADDNAPKGYDLKALFGALFATELEPYSHWAWTDLDVLWSPNLLQLLTTEAQSTSRPHAMDLLQSYDVVTCLDGGRSALYLSGQFTAFKNIPKFGKQSVPERSGAPGRTTGVVPELEDHKQSLYFLSGCLTRNVDFVANNDGTAAVPTPRGSKFCALDWILSTAHSMFDEKHAVFYAAENANAKIYFDFSLGFSSQRWSQLLHRGPQFGLFYPLPEADRSAGDELVFDRKFGLFIEGSSFVSSSLAATNTTGVVKQEGRGSQRSKPENEVGGDAKHQPVPAHHLHTPLVTDLERINMHLHDLRSKTDCFSELGDRWSYVCVPQTPALGALPSSEFIFGAAYELRPVFQLAVSGRDETQAADENINSGRHKGGGPPRDRVDEVFVARTREVLVIPSAFVHRTYELYPEPLQQQTSPNATPSRVELSENKVENQRGPVKDNGAAATQSEVLSTSEERERPTQNMKRRSTLEFAFFHLHQRKAKFTFHAANNRGDRQLVKDDRARNDDEHRIAAGSTVWCVDRKGAGRELKCREELDAGWCTGCRVVASHDH
ncbi:unnamed protein product [Amoebophrya sp. A120]|nr:unnamed protein product [Amoebophrya sp. A120]|eukprot:GSA120T00006400001.1